MKITLTLLALIALSSPTAAYAQSCCMSQDEQNYQAAEADRAQQEAQEAARAEQDRETQERSEREVEEMHRYDN
jgi:hypothetical protein